LQNSTDLNAEVGGQKQMQIFWRSDEITFSLELNSNVNPLEFIYTSISFLIGCVNIKLSLVDVDVDAGICCRSIIKLSAHFILLSFPLLETLK
jgi:hypothetical protein